MNIRNKAKLVKLSDIKPYKNNAKKHPEWQIEKIKESLLKYDYIQPIVVDDKNEIVIGHGRYEALKQLGTKDVEVIDASYLSEIDIKKLRILDNKIVSMEWDNAILQDEIDDIYGGDFDSAVSELGIKEDDIIVPEIMDDISLPEGENDFQQMTFVLSNRQAEIVKKTIECYNGENKPDDNENKNGNALELICQKSM